MEICLSNKEVNPMCDVTEEVRMRYSSSPLTHCISKINNTQINKAKDLDVVMLMYDLVAYSIDYSKTSLSLWKYYTDKANVTLTDFKLFKLK